MDKILNTINNGINWLFEPTTISWLQEEGEGTISRIGLAFCVLVIVTCIAFMVSPSFRKKLF